MKPIRIPYDPDKWFGRAKEALWDVQKIFVAVYPLYMLEGRFNRTANGLERELTSEAG